MARRSTGRRAGPSSRSQAGSLGNGIRSYDLSVAAAEAAIDELVVAWRRLHDRHADVMAGVLAFVVRRFGEPALETCYRAVLEPYIQERYMVFDVRVRPYADTLVRNLYISLEAMRGHMGGPDREGDIDLHEFDDRYELRFDPCGSGGRSAPRRPARGDRLARPRAVRVRGHHRAAPVVVERDRRLLLLRPLQLRALDPAGRALGPPGPDRGSAAVAGRG